MERSVTEIEKIFELLSKNSGFSLKFKNKSAIESAIKNRMKKLKLQTIKEYSEILECGLNNEFKNLVESILVHETYFFRNIELFERLRDIILPGLLRKRINSSDAIKIWCAGCANGCESYSVAIMCKEMQTRFRNAKVEIMGTDLSEDSLEMARRGIYPKNALRKTPDYYIERYFKFDKDTNNYQLHPEIVSAVEYRTHNLIKDTYFFNNDIIFCRNVLMYFDREIQKKVVEKFHSALNDGGYLIVGASETLRDFREIFEPLYEVAFGVYKKRVKKAQLQIVNSIPSRKLTSIKAVTRKLRESEKKDAKISEKIFVIELEGSFDEVTIAQKEEVLKRKFKMALEKSFREVFIDMKKVTYIDRDGLNYLRRAVNHIRSNGSNIVIISKNPSVLRWLEKLQDIYNIDIRETRRIKG